MRGRTIKRFGRYFRHEAQNTNTQQIKMFLTRLGVSSKMIITGDVTQIDLPIHQTSGLIHAMSVLKISKE